VFPCRLRPQPPMEVAKGRAITHDLQSKKTYPPILRPAWTLLRLPWTLQKAKQLYLWLPRPGKTLPITGVSLHHVEGLLVVLFQRLQVIFLNNMEFHFLAFKCRSRSREPRG
jgi:hypothetical protein